MKELFLFAIFFIMVAFAATIINIHNADPSLNKLHDNSYLLEDITKAMNADSDSQAAVNTPPTTLNALAELSLINAKSASLIKGATHCNNLEAITVIKGDDDSIALNISPEICETPIFIASLSEDSKTITIR
ncbi:MAG: hypothetical protein HAW67_01455 [Endozoicomonadaceae bacterium]|nr:hypothetical protein [Endozoicomonadaceae bacterium]